MKRAGHLAVAVTLAGAAHGAYGDVIVTTATDRPEYRRGDAFHIHVTARNTDPSPVTLRFPSSLQSQYMLDSAYVAPNVGLTVLTQVTIPGNGSHTWTHRHDWLDYDSSVGRHEATGSVVNQGWGNRAAFEVVAAKYPKKGFVVDFDKTPGGAADATRPEEYWPTGVRFGSNGGRPVIANAAGDGHLRVNSTTYPPGFNLTADFDVTVYHASADVSAAAGASVTMVAKDAAGRIVDTAVSDPVPGLAQFVPVAVEADVPIASIE